jgi:hypothetical protein
MREGDREEIYAEFVRDNLKNKRSLGNPRFFFIG